MKIIVNYSTTKEIEMNNEDFDRLYKIASHFSSISSEEEYLEWKNLTFKCGDLLKEKYPEIEEILKASSEDNVTLWEY